MSLPRSAVPCFLAVRLMPILSIAQSESCWYGRHTAISITAVRCTYQCRETSFSSTYCSFSEIFQQSCPRRYLQSCCAHRAAAVSFSETSLLASSSWLNNASVALAKYFLAEDASNWKQQNSDMLLKQELSKLWNWTPSGYLDLWL